jgi:anti-sigma factor (TIGR02949 family)
MNCTMAQRVLDAWIDDELDVTTAGEIAEHVASCAACAELRDRRVAVRAALKGAALHHPAPAGLRSSVLRRIRNLEQAGPGGRAARWWQMLALGASTALIGAFGGWWIAQPHSPEGLPVDIVARHVASLMPEGPRIDVASTDRHVVRPWFQGRLDFAPIVRDLSAQGFELLGARLDHIGGQAAVAVVYRLHQHAINVFSWRVLGNAAETSRQMTIRGFNVVTWSESDMNYAAVSDTDSAELDRFAAAYRQP